MESFTSFDQYQKELEERTLLPQGFSFGACSLEFFPKERPTDKALPMKLSLIVADEPCDRFALVMTKNAFPGAPILLARERMKQKYLRGAIINNKISNVGAPHGLETAKRLSEETANLLGMEKDALLSVSTGIIGWSLPIDDMTKALPKLKESLGKKNGRELAEAIMTTDRYPKLRSVQIGDAKIFAVAKGAGMIEPNLATMLVFILTDAKISRADLEKSLKLAVDQSFNCISVDSDQSTSDLCLIMSSNTRSIPSIEDFQSGLAQVLGELARDIVHNGEGTRHVIEVEVQGFGEHNKAVGKAIVNSPLVKTAIYGNDPNLGRLLSSMGDYLGNNDIPFDRNKLKMTLMGEEIFNQGVFLLDKEKEIRLSDGFKKAMMDPEKTFPEHRNSIKIMIQYGNKKDHAVILGSDLGYEYVKENADYRS